MLNKICTVDTTYKITRDTVATVTIHTLAGSMSAIRAVTIVSVLNCLAERESNELRLPRYFCNRLPNDYY